MGCEVVEGVVERRGCEGCYYAFGVSTDNKQKTVLELDLLSIL